VATAEPVDPAMGVATLMRIHGDNQVSRVTAPASCLGVCGVRRTRHARPDVEPKLLRRSAASGHDVARARRRTGAAEQSPMQCSRRARLALCASPLQHKQEE
jgi:hypothetical protein